MMIAPEVSVILPTYNERESLPRVVEEIHAALRQTPHELIIVDDDSPDGTGRWVEDAAQRDPSLRLVRRTAQPGLSAAVLDGFRVSRSDRWIVMDADGQHDPSVLPSIVKGLDRHELVVPSRYAPGGSTGTLSLSRWVASRGATGLAKWLLDVPLSDPVSGFFGIRREAYEAVAPAMNPRGFKILLELYYRLSRRSQTHSVNYVELPYRFRPRVAGESKLTRRIAWQYLQMLLALRAEARRHGGA